MPSSTANAEIYKPSMLKPSPVLLSLSGDGQGPGAIFHADTHQIISSDNPASVGEALEVYCTTGLGDGSDDSVIPPQVAIGGPCGGSPLFRRTDPGDRASAERR